MRSSQFIAACCLSALLAAFPASAAVFKCVDSKGSISFQEQPCPTSTKGAEVSVKGVQAAMSPEDQMWMNDRKSLVIASCMDSARASAYRVLSTAERTEACECTARKLFNHPVAKLRKLEETNNSKGIMDLSHAIGEACGKELLAARRKR